MRLNIAKLWRVGANRLALAAACASAFVACMRFGYEELDFEEQQLAAGSGSESVLVDPDAGSGGQASNAASDAGSGSETAGSGAMNGDAGSGMADGGSSAGDTGQGGSTQSSAGAVGDAGQSGVTSVGGSSGGASSTGGTSSGGAGAGGGSAGGAGGGSSTGGGSTGGTSGGGSTGGASGIGGTSGSGGTSGGGSGGTAGVSGAGSGGVSGGGTAGASGSGGQGGCTTTNGGFESCDGLDNNCDGDIDELGCPATCRGVIYGGNGYMFCDAELDWWTAKQECETDGMHLAKIDNSQENTFLGDEAYQGSSSLIWTGGYDDPSDGWVWYDGSPFGWINWASGEPAPGKRDCTQLLDDYTWGTKLCDSSARYVCELL